MKSTEQVLEEAAGVVLRAHGYDLTPGLRLLATDHETLAVTLGTTITTLQGLAELVDAAISIDRAQRDIYELIAEALDDRAENWEAEDDPASREIAARQRRAAATLRNNNGDTAWDHFIGPMLDAIETEYGE